MQIKERWTGKHGEMHGEFKGGDLEIVRRGRRGTHRIRIVPADGGVEIISTLSDGLMARAFVPVKVLTVLDN